MTAPVLDRPGDEDADADGSVPAPAARRGGRTPRSAWRGAAVLVGLAGVAMTQPLLDMLGRNPEFFVAGAYRPRQVVTFALIVALVPSAIAVAVVTLVRLLSRRAGEVAHTVFVLVLAATFGLVLGHSLGLRSLVPAVGFAAAVALVTAVAERRWPAARGFLSYLAVGNVAFLLLFVFASPTAKLISAGGVDLDGEVVVPPLPGPVVLVVLDEFPLTTILRPDGTINDARYPRLAELASTSTWFRNASSHFPLTSLSAPAILSGRISDNDDLPTYTDHPRNLFTLFAEERYPIRRYEVVTDMCPPAQCAREESSSIGTALEDAAIAYGHRALPDELADDLAPIDVSWGNFGQDGDTGGGGGGDADEPDPMARWDEIPENELGPAGQAGAFVRAVRDIDAEPTVNFIHIAVPHNPWVLTPWGTAITKWIGELPSIPGDPASPNMDFVARERYQLQSMQIGAVDQLVGGMVDHLKDVGAWDDATVIVTSDHGTSMTPPVLGRRVRGGNQADLLRIPLFVKAPGQREGRVRDEPAHTYDVLPSLVDLLDIEVGWDFDGHSLFDGSEPTVDPMIRDESVWPAMATAADHAKWFPRGDDWTALVAVGEGAELVGSPVAAFSVGEPSEYRASLDDADLLDDLPTDDNQVPYLLIGTLSGASERPPELVVSVNGTLAGVVGGYDQHGADFRFHGVVGNWFVDGRNELALFEVERGGGGVVLHQVGDASSP